MQSTNGARRRLLLASAVSCFVMSMVVVIAMRKDPKRIEAFSGPFSLEQQYMSLHPVYTRCAQKADLESFSRNVLLHCGDVHELTGCAPTCSRALQTYADATGCCWETVMQGLEEIDVNAAGAWRDWQGTASGKCGVSFDEASCGESMGEKSFGDLSDTVNELKYEARMNQEFMNELQNTVFGYGSYAQRGAPTLVQERVARAGRAQSLALMPSLAEEPVIVGGFPIAEGILQGQVDETYHYGQNFGLGLPAAAEADPVTGVPLLEADAEYPATRARLTAEAAARQAGHDAAVPDESFAGALSRRLPERTANPQPSAGFDQGSYKLERMGILVR